MANSTISDQYGEYLTLRGEDGKPVVLGKGGFGVTVCAYKLRKLGGVEIRDEFALKILRYSAIEDSRRRSRILKEILALRDLQHPNLASYKDCGEDEGCVFLVMELCRGGDLAALAARLGALPERFALQVILQVCAGLDEAHRKGYFHRDLKPTNILIGEELRADADLPWLEERLASGHLRFKVVDFGLAGRFESEVQGGGFMGSPMFASPEQVREQRLDSRSDIYSLGMTLWYLVTGKGPLLNAQGLPVADAREAMRCHTSLSQHDLAFPEHFSTGFRALLGRMVRKVPEERFRSAQELAEAIRRQIEAMPTLPEAVETQQVVTMPPKAMPASVATWGIGTFAEYYHVLKQVGRRSIGTFYQARQTASGNIVGFTAWVAENSPHAASEKIIGQHLDRLKAVTNDTVAPKTLIRIVDWLRTTDEWCVAEEWLDGEKLDRFVSVRHGAFPEIARLLWPLAEACDFLQQQRVYSALLSLDEIRLLSPRAKAEAINWIELPMDEWGDWAIRLSAMSIPQELAGESIGPGAVESSTTSRFDGCDAGQLRFNKSFCRLLYRLIEGTEAAVAADWDAQAFTASGKLSAESNALLRDYICGAFADDPTLDILKRVCLLEGLACLPGSAESIAAPSVTPTRVLPVADLEVNPKTLVNLPPTLPSNATTQVAPVSTVQPSGSTFSAARSSAAGSRYSRRSEPILEAAPANQIEVAQLIPGRPGWVRRPHGSRREQQVPGVQWRENARVECQSVTGRFFQLPSELPALEAILINERFDAVLTPYVDPPQEVPVPLGKWAAGVELICPVTQRPLRQPQQLPAASATLIEGRPGVVKSPYVSSAEVEVKADSWKPGQLLACPSSGQLFALPAVLPALLALPGEARGSFTSPYAPDRPFNLPAPKCVPGQHLLCPWTSQPLALPATLPSHWQFEGSVRQAGIPEARSPYLESEDEAWQALPAADWRPRAIIECERTKRPFTLPGTLPALRVDAGKSPFSVCSPFPPHEEIRLPADVWIPGAEAILSLGVGTPFHIVLPDELPSLEHLEIAELDSVPQGRQPQARGPRGAIRSPFADDHGWIEIPAPQWRPGTRVTCPATSRSFWLPKELPMLEARLGSELGTVCSPFTDHEVKVPAAEWIAGSSFQCPETGGIFTLPRELPLLHGGVDESRPGWVESPFETGSAYLIEFAEWKPGMILECPTSERTFALPQFLPEWIPEAELDVANPGMVRNPQGPGEWFKVAGVDWKAQTVVHSPEADTKLTLPAELPALEATLVESKPGYVATPYTGKGEPVKIHSSKWHSGSLVECPLTGRPLRLPDDLPPYRPAPSPWHKLLMPALAAMSLLVIGLLIFKMFEHYRLERLRAKFRQEAETTFVWEIPPDLIPSPPPPPPPPVTAWPRSIILVQGIEPPDAAVHLVSSDGKRTKIEPDAPTSSVKRTIQLAASSNAAVQSWLTDNAKGPELTVQFEAPGFESSKVKVSRGKPNDLFEINAGGELKREQGTVRWETKAPFFPAAYAGIRFELNNAPRGHKDIEDQPVPGGSVSLPTGEYAVTLIGRKNPVTKEKFSDSRVIDSKLTVARNAPAELHFPPALPQRLGGFGIYTTRLPLVAVNKAKGTVDGKGTEEVFNYWTPCLISFEKDFRTGNLIEENSLISTNLMLTLDLIVYKLTQDDKDRSPGKPLDEYPGYKDNVELLNAAFKEAGAFASFENLLEQSPERLLDKRKKVFGSVFGIWNSVKKRNLEGKFYEGRIGDVQSNDITLMYRWISKAQSVLASGEWNRVVSALLKADQAQVKREDVASLQKLVEVGGRNLSSVFVQQGFELSRVDESGRCDLRLKATFANPSDPPNLIVKEWIARMQFVKDQWQLVGECLGNREIRMFEMKGN